MQPSYWLKTKDTLKYDYLKKNRTFYIKKNDFGIISGVPLFVCLLKWYL